MFWPNEAALMPWVVWQSLHSSASSPERPCTLVRNALAMPWWHFWQTTGSGPPADFSLAERVACGLWQSEHSGAFSLPLRTSAECTLSSYSLTVFLWQSRQVSMRSSELARLLAIALGCLPWSFKSISEWQPSQPPEACTDPAKALAAITSDNFSPFARVFSSSGLAWHSRHAKSSLDKLAVLASAAWADETDSTNGNAAA